MSVDFGGLTSLWRRRWACICALALLGPIPLLAATDGAAQDPDDLFDVPLADLAELPVVSVAGVAQDWFSTPAAVHVITRDEIRRSGHTHLAELFRMVPGFYVGRATSSEWATGVRGFADVFYPYLQARVDGRVIYNELFSGVYWDVQTPLLEDVDQIEVVRGPGATLWGANAVNGVINIKTRSAENTQGAYLSAGGGSEDRAFGMARYGAEPTPGLAIRGWARYFDRDATVNPEGDRRNDAWSVFRGGARMDWAIDDATTLMAQGEGYTTPMLEQSREVAIDDARVVVRGDGEARGAHGLLRLTRESGSAETRDRSGFTIQAYYDYEDRNNVIEFAQERHTVDIDLRHHFMLGSRNELIWGAGYRYRLTDTTGIPTLRLIPPKIDSDLATLFVQDTIELIPNSLFLMLGSKFEYNSFTGFEIQPSARAWWTPNDRHTLWAAVSRPVRAPSLINQFLDITFFSTELGRPVNLLGDPDIESENLLAYELGYRMRPLDSLTLDVAAFYFDYDDFYALEETFEDSGVATFTNNNRAESAGVELAVRWSPLDRWQLHGSYSYLHVSSPDVGLNPTGGIEGRDPAHQFQIRSYLDLTEDVEFNAGLYFVDSVDRFDVPSYFRLDLGFTWRPVEHVELALWGQNLTASRHRESGVTTPNEGAAEIQRGVYGRVRLAF